MTGCINEQVTAPLAGALREMVQVTPSIFTQPARKLIYQLLFTESCFYGVSPPTCLVFPTQGRTRFHGSRKLSADSHGGLGMMMASSTQACIFVPEKKNQRHDIFISSGPFDDQLRKKQCKFLTGLSSCHANFLDPSSVLRGRFFFFFFFFSDILKLFRQLLHGHFPLPEIVQPAFPGTN